MQSADCQLTSCGDVTKFVVISNDEQFAAYCHIRHGCSETSSVSQLRKFL